MNKEDITSEEREELEKLFCDDLDLSYLLDKRQEFLI